MHLLCKYVCKNKQFIYFVIQKVDFFIIMNKKSESFSRNMVNRLVYFLSEDLNRLLTFF